ncbi:MAG: hypothetical protein COB12_03425 [Flavobacterium sp.]|nr:MAG: hypothetical protein COB12_03425 [Flavobacterium sp.]
MKLKVLLIVFINFNASFFLTAQENNTNIIKLEKQADSLYYNLSTQYSDKNYIQTLDIINEILTKYTDTTSLNYKTTLTKKYASTALYLMKKNRFDSAIVYSKKALKIINSNKKQNLLLKGHISMHLYEQTAYNDDWKTALKLAKETRQIFKDTLVNNHKLIADVEFDIGYATTQFGDYTTVLKQYNIAKDLYISFMGENNYDVALKYQHLALVYGNVGFYKKELESYKKSIKIWETIDYKDKSYLSIAYTSLTTWYLQHGDYKTAELYLIKNEHLIKEYKQSGTWYNETFKGRTLLSVWDSYAQLHRFKKDSTQALAFNAKIVTFLNDFDFNDKSNNPNNFTSETIHNWINAEIISALLFKAGIIKNTDPETAKLLYEEIVQIKEENNIKQGLVSTYIKLLQYASKEKNYKKAHHILDKILLTSKKTHDDYAIMQLYAEKAKLALKQDSVLAMHQNYKQVFKRLLKDDSKIISIQNLNYKDCKPFSDKSFVNLLIKAGGNYKEAYSNTKDDIYLKTAYNINKLVSDIFSNNYVFSEFNDKTYHTVTKINEQLLNTTLLLKNEVIYDEILQKTEESNSRLSWMKFLNSNQRKYLDIPQSVLEKENELKAQVHFYKKSLFLSKEYNEDKTKLWKERLFDLNKEIDSLNNWYQQNYASYFNQTQKVFDLKELKNKLKDNQRIVKYIFAKNNVYAYVITKRSTHLIKIGSKNELVKKLQPLIKSLTKPNTTNYKNAATLIYNLLLPTQLLGLDTKQELIFIRDDILHYLPMEVLIDAQGKFLVESHTVSYASSLLLWNEELQAKKSKNNTLGIFVPTYSSTTKQTKRSEYGELLGANNEAHEIAKLFKSDLFLGKEASKQAFIKEAKNYSLLHLAMHSTINNIDSEFSNLAFSGNKDDNKLFISELYNISLDADLVVLSACNTAVGNIKKGEGLVNVSRAFTYAGVPSTVTSLWEVPDKETSQIMISFYNYLKEGKSKNKALQLAKLDYLNTVDDEVLRHPYYWAGFIISGNTSPINTPNYYIIWLILGVFLIALVGFVIYNRKLKNAA